MFQAVLVEPLAPIVIGMNQLLVIERANANAAAEAFPAKGLVYRGAVIPQICLEFFKIGRKYRVPGVFPLALFFLLSSRQQAAEVVVHAVCPQI